MKSFSEQIDDSLANLAWSLWNELGVAGINRYHQDCLISLEELIILTAVISETDPRLRDEALDWCVKYHHFVSISRLRTLLKDFDESTIKPFYHFAATLNSLAQLDWPVLTKMAPLSLKMSGKSKSPNCKAPALLGLRLRALFGVGARADLITFFVTHKGSFTASDTVEIGYSKRSLADLLDYFVESGLFTVSAIRNQRTYELVKSEEFVKLIGALPKIAPSWRKILQLLIPIRNIVKQCEKKSVDTKMVVMRNFLLNKEKLLQELNLSPPLLELDPSQFWNSFTHWLLNTIEGNFLDHFKIDNELDTIMRSLMQSYYNVDDCLDGLRHIIIESQKDLNKHEKVFKECYQLCLCFIEELAVTLKDFLNFPFHNLNDFALTDIPYQYSQNQLKGFLKFYYDFPPLDRITDQYHALRQYEILKSELSTINEFIYKFDEQLKSVYFSQTNRTLSTQSRQRHKRNLILKLF